MKAYSAESLVTYYNDALELESEILADSGDFRGAYENLLRLQHSRDSLASEQLAIQLSEFYTLYEVDRLEARRQRQKIVIVMTGSLCLLLLITIAVFIVYEAVKEGAGMTVSGFIAEYRLNHSVALLSERKDISLEEVAEMSGFGAYSSFFRKNTKKFGMTPQEYKKYLK